MVEWLSQRYEIDERQLKSSKTEIGRLESCKDLKRLLFVEGRIAEVYWKVFQSLIPKKYGFVSRTHETHQMNSTDPVNTLLNYGYAFLESRCRTSINAVGLEPSIGFLHEIAQPKYPLVYDLQEPFRWIIDKTIISCVENEKFSRKDFFMTDNYVLRLSPPAIKRLLKELRCSLSSRIQYKSRNYSWDEIVRLKTEELGRYVSRKVDELDFKDPNANFNTEDSGMLRERILFLTPSKAREIGISKSTLWELQKRAQADKPFRTYEKVGKKISIVC